LTRGWLGCETTDASVNHTNAAGVRFGQATIRASIGAMALALTAVIALAACGGSGSSSTPSPTPSPSSSPSPSLIAVVQACNLVMAADASTAAGKTMTNPSTGGAVVPGACFYASADGKTSIIVFAQVYPDSITAQSVSAAQIAAALPGAGSGLTNAKAVNGIGDKAVEYSTSSAGSSATVILVFKSNVLVMIVMSPAPSSTRVIEQLATTAVGRL
jgi:hypothetical protein